MRSVFDGIAPVKAIDPCTIAGTGTPNASRVQAVDTFGYNSCMFEVATGTPGGTAASVVVTLQVTECATSTGTYANVSGATGTIASYSGTGSAKHVQIRVESLGTTRLRYLKLVLTVTNTPNDGQTTPVAAIALLGNAFRKPISNAATA